MNKSERKKLKRFAEVCMGSCSGCKHFDFFKGFCIKRKEKRGSNDPACNQYTKYSMS